jgi:hypothetical protein
MWKMPDGLIFADVGLRASSANLRKRVGYKLGEPFSLFRKRVGAMPVPGFQLRYIYFLDPTARARLTVPILPFSEIDRRGAGMYKGKQRIQSRAGGDTTDTPVFQTGEGGSTPTSALQSSE